MASSHTIPITRHAVPHIPRLTVDPSILSARYARDCTSRNCDGGCCGRGVWVDLEHRAAILASAELVQLYMTPEQEHDPARWFGGEIKDDSDFPSGRAIGTETYHGGCVFLDPSRRCVLHTVDDAEKPTTRLKPFYCRIYPLVLDAGVLTLDEPAGGERPACCTETAGGDRTVFDVCTVELEEVLGPEGLRDLHAAVAEGRG
jgi:Protein of unknown function (DUF3109)